MSSNPWREGFEDIVFRTVNDQPTLWDAILPAELLVLPAELGRVDELLDDPVFFAPFATYFDARIGRPSIPMETYLRLMFLKFRYRLGYESLCREVGDSISWQRFCGSSQMRVWRPARRYLGRGRGLPMMGVLTLPIRKTSTCTTLPLVRASLALM